MTRWRESGDPNAGEPEAEQLESGNRLGGELEDASVHDSLLAADDGPPPLPLLDSEAGPARPLAAQELLVLADRIERQFLAQRSRPVSRLTPRRWLLAGGLFAASAAAAVVGLSVAHRGAEPPVTKPAEAVVAAPATVPSVAEPSVVSPPLALEPGPSEPGTDEPDPEPGTDEPEPEPGTDEQPANLGVAKRTDTAPKSGNSSVVSANLPNRASRIGATGRPNSPQNERRSGRVAADRLAAANGLRSRHRYREALALYLQVIEIAPNGMQASVARVAAADMKLEQFGDVAGAERLYREAKTQGGELTAEAQFGLSQVARARGDAPGELRTLQDFLGRHPESPLATAARRRLNALGAE